MPTDMDKQINKRADTMGRTRNLTTAIHDWTRLAEMSGNNTVSITLVDGTHDGFLVWDYQRGNGYNCWVVTRTDDEGHQLGPVNRDAVTRYDLPSTLQKMGGKTMLDLDPWWVWFNENLDHVVNELIPLKKV